MILTCIVISSFHGEKQVFYNILYFAVTPCNFINYRKAFDPYARIFISANNIRHVLIQTVAYIKY